MAVELSKSRIGAEVLATIVRERANLRLRWAVEGKVIEFVFSGGKCIATDELRPQTIKALRALAIASSGSCSWSDASGQPAGRPIDTLGETLVAVSRALPAPLVVGLEIAWANVSGQCSPVFAQLNQALQKVGAASVVAFEGSVALTDLLGADSIEQQRSWIALALLGGLALTPPPPTLAQMQRTQVPSSQPTAKPVAPTPSPKEVAPTSTPSPSPQPFTWPTDPGDRAAAEKIRAFHDTMKEGTHYDVLKVASDVSKEDIKNAYLKIAKEWHPDRFTKFDLADAKKLLDEILQRASEAHKTLTDDAERENYDFVLDRQAKGLPTDVGVILEAEAMFKKGQAMVRRGAAAKAEPILRQAIEMNKGEAEFWAYLGYSIYAAHGSDKLDEAKEAIQQAMTMEPNLDVSYEFLGRIYRVEGDLPRAEANLRKAIERNPKNVDATREMRLLQSQAEKKSGLLDKILKK